MKRWLVGLLVLLSPSAFAQQSVPEIPYNSVPNLLKLPPDMHLGEIAGVAVNSKGHIYVYSRGGSSQGPAFGNTASQILEFDRNGVFLREIGKNLYAWAYAHTVRVDKDDNIWATDKGSDMVVKFNPEGRVEMVFGRKTESSDREAHAHERNANPPLPHVDQRFRQPTDVTWDAAGNIYISDGYVNSRVAKFDKNGDWVKSWGQRGKGPGEFNLVHTIAADAQGNIYVGDRNNRRIQVFDGDGNFKREIKIDVPFDANAKPAIGNKPDLSNLPADRRQPDAGRAMGALHHAAAQPGALQLGCVSRPHLQAEPRRQGARLSGQVGQAAEAVRMDPRDRLPVRERALRGRDSDLAGAEADPAAGSAAGRRREPVELAFGRRAPRRPGTRSTAAD